MTDYIEITTEEVDIDSPVTDNLITKLRDNPLAIAEGATGAPRVQDAALASGAPTSTGASWVGQRMAVLPLTYVGSLAFAAKVSDGSLNRGETIAGSDLITSSSSPNQSEAGVTGNLTGTWTCLGSCFTGTGGGSGTFQRTATLFIKTA